MKRRPSLYILLSVIAGAVSGFYVQELIYLLILLPSCCALLFIIRSNPLRLLIFLLLCTTSTALVSFLKHQHYRDIAKTLPEKAQFYEGYILSLSQKFSGEKVAMVRMTALNFAKPSSPSEDFFIRLHLKEGAAALKLDEGDRIRLYGKALSLRKAFYPFSFNESIWGMVHNIHGRMTITKGHFVQIMGHEESLLMKLRRTLLSFLKANLSPHEQSIIRANILGDTGLFTNEQRDLYRQIGAEHLLAVSGLQISLLIWVIFFLAIPLVLLFLPRNFCHYSRPLSALLALAIVVIFLFLCYGQKSALRAVFMACLFLLPQINRRHIDQWDAMILSALIILLIDVNAIFDLSFLFSFAAVIGLLISHQMSRPLVDKVRPFSFLAAHFILAICLSIGTVLSVWPITIVMFGTIAPYAAIANLFIIPIASVLQIPIIAGAFIAFFVSMPSLLHIARLSAMFLERCVEKCADYLGLVVTVPEHLSLMLAGYCWLFFLLFALLLHKKWRIAIGLSSFMLLGIVPFFYKPEQLEVTVFAVGQGDSTLFKSPEMVMLIDGGGSFGDFDPGEKIVVPRLKAKGVTEIDYLVVTHPDLDHIEGLFAVIDEIKIKEIWFHEGSKEHPLIKKLLAHIEPYSIEAKAISTSFTLPLSDGFIDVYVPHSLEKQNDNNKSLVVKMSYQGISFLWTGDIEKEAEEELLNKNAELKADILKAPHHGSLSSSIQPFVDAVRPQHVIFTTGPNNRFGFPKKQVMERYEDIKSVLWDTAKNGEITAIVKNSKLHITSKVNSSKDTNMVSS